MDKATGERYVTDAEMQAALVDADDDFQSRTLWQLEQWSSKRPEGDGNWRATVPVFLSEVWPRQIRAKRPRITARLLDLALSDVTTFAEITDIILLLVTESDRKQLLYGNTAEPLPHLSG